MLAAYIDEIIMFFAGAWATAVGFGYLSASKDPIAEGQWRARFGKHLKWIGPLLLGIATVLAVAQFTGVSGAT